jgi:hypothetical protein
MDINSTNYKSITECLEISMQESINQTTNLISLPVAVAIHFSAAPPEWRIDTIKKLQHQFWSLDELPEKRSVYTDNLDNLDKNMWMNAIDAGVAFDRIRDLLAKEEHCEIRDSYAAMIADAEKDADANANGCDECDECDECDDDVCIMVVAPKDVI